MKLLSWPEPLQQGSGELGFDPGPSGSSSMLLSTSRAASHDGSFCLPAGCPTSLLWVGRGGVIEESTALEVNKPGFSLGAAK